MGTELSLFLLPLATLAALLLVVFRGGGGAGAAAAASPSSLFRCARRFVRDGPVLRLALGVAAQAEFEKQKSLKPGYLI